MNRSAAALGSFVWLALAPGTVCGLVPWLITGWRRPDDAVPWIDALGWILVLAGAAVLVHAFARFVREGLGTPAPVAPTSHLVVGGLYRYVRNPIYVAGVAIIVGQALLFGAWGLVLFGAVLWLAFHLFVVAYEEPTLHETFGAEYEAYRANVRRWVPRVVPWRAPAGSGS